MRRNFVIIMLLLFFSISVVRAGEQASAPIRVGERIIGLKLAAGSVFGSNLGFVLSGEYGFKQNWLSIKGLPNHLGIGGSIGYSSFSEFVFPWGNYFYQNYLFLGSAFWHVDVFRKRTIDTYMRANFGLNIDVTSKPTITAPGIESTYGGFVFGLSLGGRYYFSSKMAAAVELGFGMGNMRVGMDYKF